ncbi:DUF5327 family protein [Salinicoccus jeotgali]|uniref:DUF5327 family protein n=1 Tax=Salinicoccus jeotgali TaxID=381634 RepID=A0ABP7F721_9STAP
MRREIIAELKQELNLMETADGQHEFDKHVYAMERLLSLLKTGEDAGDARPEANHTAPGSMSETDRSMLEQMGGRVPHSTRQETKGRQLETEDGSGNGESLFDF